MLLVNRATYLRLGIELHAYCVSGSAGARSSVYCAKSGRGGGEENRIYSALTSEHPTVRLELALYSIMAKVHSKQKDTNDTPDPWAMYICSTCKRHWCSCKPPKDGPQASTSSKQCTPIRDLNNSSGTLRCNGCVVASAEKMAESCQKAAEATELAQLSAQYLKDSASCASLLHTAQLEEGKTLLNQYNFFNSACILFMVECNVSKLNRENAETKPSVHLCKLHLCKESIHRCNIQRCTPSVATWDCFLEAVVRHTFH